MTQILVVDDEADLELLIRQRFRKQIQNNEFEFLFAQNGVRALELLGKEPNITMVLSDINMPEMDGLTLIDRINEKYAHLICVVISAYGDLANIRSAMNLGAFDFVTKPINFSDLNITIEQALKHVALLRGAETDKLKLNSILQELNVAATIQQSILPKRFITNSTLELYATMKPAREIGGDFYDFFNIGDDTIGFIIADVSGKGVPAALFMTVSRTLVRAHAATEHSPGLCLQKVNELLAKENENMRFVTAFYGQLNYRTGHVVFANAGHNRPYWLKKSGEMVLLQAAQNVPLGIMEQVIYNEGEIDLEPGDRLFLYTDGLTDAIDGDSKKYGEQPTIDLLKTIQDKTVQEQIELVKNQVEQFSKGQPQFDDITMLELKYAPIRS